MEFLKKINRKIKNNSVIRWLAIGVIPVYIPVFLGCLVDYYSEYTIGQIVNKHLTDWPLMTFSVAIGIFGISLDGINGNNDKLYERYILVAFVLALVGGIVGMALYDRPTDGHPCLNIGISIVFIIFTSCLSAKGFSLNDEDDNFEDTK